MKPIVVDTNVIIAALISRKGKAFQLISMVDAKVFTLCLSASLVLEYEDVIKRLLGTKIMDTEQEIENFLDYLCKHGQHQRIYYLWRPYLIDPKDDMILELAVSSESKIIVTYNTEHFRGVDRFGIQVVTPSVFLSENGLIP